LYVDRGLNRCDCLWIWMKNEKLWVLIPCLLWFWLSFDVYKLVHKFGERIWFKGDQKREFWVKMMGSWEEPKFWVVVCCATRRGEWSLVVASDTGQNPQFWSFRVFGVDPDVPKWFFLMYLTVVMLSKHLETSNELDWTWFCESNQTFWKMFKHA